MVKGWRINLQAHLGIAPGQRPSSGAARSPILPLTTFPALRRPQAACANLIVGFSRAFRLFHLAAAGDGRCPKMRPTNLIDWGAISATNGEQSFSVEWIKNMKRILLICISILVVVLLTGNSLFAGESVSVLPRERILIDNNWRFTQGDPTNCTVSLLYDVRRGQNLRRFSTEADGNSAINQSADEASNEVSVIKAWILPTGNEFIKDPARRYKRPEGNPGDGVSYAQPDFDDSAWEPVTLPHDWAIAGPFTHSGGGQAWDDCRRPASAGIARS